jgi:hypothetical protein
MIVFHDEPLHIHATSSPFLRIRSSAALWPTSRSLDRDRFFAHPCLLIAIVTLIRHGEPLLAANYTITCTGAATSTPQTSSMNLKSTVMAMEALRPIEMLCVDSIGYVPVLFSCAMSCPCHGSRRRPAVIMGNHRRTRQSRSEPQKEMGWIGRSSPAAAWD